MKSIIVTSGKTGIELTIYVPHIVCVYQAGSQTGIDTTSTPSGSYVVKESVEVVKQRIKEAN